MSRLLFLLVVIAVVYWLLRSYRKSPKQDTPAATEDMVRCAQCGVHLPKSESILSNSNFYCCDAHRREYESK